MSPLPILRHGRVVRNGETVTFRDPWREEELPLVPGEVPPPPEDSWVEVECRGAEAWLREVLAEPGSARAAVYLLAAHHGVDPVLPAACEAEAEAWRADPGIQDARLVDLTHLPFCTIDNPDSRDLDQALYVSRAREGHEVWYALADASFYVRPGSALMQEALRRGATFYMPGLVAPMLPRSLCEDLVSLNPEVDRRAMVLRMRVGGDGRCLGTEVSRARIHSRAKLSYQGVQAWLDGGEAPCRDGAVLESLEALVEVGEARLREAESRNVVRFRRQEVSVSVGGRGMAFVAQASPRNDVERYNEQISLLANVEAARLLKAAADDPRVQPVFRTHEPPLKESLESFAEQLEALVRAHSLPPEFWSWSPRSAESLAHYIRRLPLERGEHQGVARAIQRQALRTGGRSGFEARPRGHHGVGAEVYSRFTAPMREVVGIFVHKELFELLGLEEPEPAVRDERVRDRVLEVSQAVRRTQRALDQEGNRLVLDQLFEKALGEEALLGAVVMGVGRGKVHLRLEDPPIDAKAYTRDLEEARGERLRLRSGEAQVLDARGQVLWRVGDRVQVRVRGMDPESDRWRLDLVALPGAD